MDRFRELNAFIAVVETGGFSAAARRTGESQSAVSKAVGALERRLGVALLHRSTRKVTLTDQGQRYYAPSTFGRLHVLPLIPDLLARHPDLRVDLVLSDALRDMVEDRIDLAIRLSMVNDPDSVVRRAAGTSLICAGSSRYFKRYGKPETPADLARHNCLIYGEMTEWNFRGPEGRFSVPVRGNLSSNSAETILAGVKAGVGIGMFHRASLAEEFRDADVIAVLEDFVHEPRDISLVWPKRRFVPTRVRAATDFFAAALPLRL
jgi:DNA-binding transcriptional LysR family regulator